MVETRDSVDSLWRALAPEAVVARGDGWLGINKASGVGERLPYGPENNLPARVSATLGGAPCQVLSPPLGGFAEPERAADALASGVSLVGSSASSVAHAPPNQWRQQWWVGLRGVAELDALRAGITSAEVKFRVQERREDRALVVVDVKGADNLSWLKTLRKMSPTLEATTPPSWSNRGDAEPAEHRPWLHRSRLRIGEIDLQAPPPASFMAWVRGEAPPTGLTLMEALNRRYSLGLAEDTDAFRLLDDERRFTLDLYHRDLVLASYDALPDPMAAPEVIERAIKAARDQARAVGEALNAERVWLKLRPRQANQIIDAAALGLAPTVPAMGSVDSSPEQILERGVRYRVHLDKGLSTGLFLDQRDNRAWLKRVAGDKRVLNTFSYTCGFSVAAAVGGARRTVSVDAAAPALETGRENFALNGLEVGERNDLIRGDVFQWLPRLARRGDRFDLIVLDPPSYARVKKRRFSAGRDYADLVKIACAALDSTGVMLCCLNHAQTTRRRFEQMVREGCRQAGRKIVNLRHQAPGVDHPSGRMKSIRVQVTER